MHEIIFRGKRKDNGKWCEGYYLHQRESLTDKEACYIAANSGYGFNYISVLPETVCQYTGLTDKNGRKIFEGDIVKIADFQIGCVIYGCGAFGIAVNSYIDWDYLDSEIAEITGCNNNPYFCRNDNFISLWELMWNYNQEESSCYVADVIGNIYDNPELLKGGNENG